jgi:hypothetical protein
MKLKLSYIDFDLDLTIKHHKTKGYEVGLFIWTYEVKRLGT